MFRSARAELEQQWEIDDADGDGTLAESEMRLSPLADVWRDLAAVTTPVDAVPANATKSLKRADWKRYLDLLEPAAALRVEARLVDHGRPLANYIDRNGDRALSLREFAQARVFVTEQLGGRDLRIDWDEIPRLVTIRFSLGTPVGRSKSEAAIAARSARPEAPKWFVAMDRNEDGDVSRREFLGTGVDFARLDADRDGLIDAEEAAAAK